MIFKKELLVLAILVNFGLSIQNVNSDDSIEKEVVIKTVGKDANLFCKGSALEIEVKWQIKKNGNWKDVPIEWFKVPGVEKNFAIYNVEKFTKELFGEYRCISLIKNNEADYTTLKIIEFKEPSIATIPTTTTTVTGITEMKTIPKDTKNDITIERKEYKIAQGATETIVCKYSVTGTKITWKFRRADDKLSDWGELPLETLVKPEEDKMRVKLYLFNFNKKLAGQYKCYSMTDAASDITNVIEEMKTIATDTKNDITIERKEYKIATGATATIVCKYCVKGTKITWKFKGADDKWGDWGELPSESLVVSDGDIKRVNLLLFNFNKKLAGQYKCSSMTDDASDITNVIEDTNTITSPITTTTNTRNDSGKINNIKIEDYVVDYGSPVKLRCHYDPKYFTGVKWYFKYNLNTDYVPFPPAWYGYLSPGELLITLRYATHNYAGFYDCWDRDDKKQLKRYHLIVENNK